MLRFGLLLTTALTACTGAAFAQAQDPGNAARTDQNQLEEVVVTATRQTDTVNRVPLSITAQTQRSLDQLGIRNVTDLQATVPALSVQRVGGAGVATVAIRGIQQGGQGAATTGFYLDDTPLQKRNAGGQDGTSANGTPLPALFDLDRIEVLRGPQGTLFGGGSEGGTIRYITPQPSLTRYSTYARAEASTTENGTPSYEGGVAFGGPIVQDKLGFRASVYKRHNGGFIDVYNPFTQALRYRNANDSDGRLFRGSLLWAPTEQLRITAAYFDSREHNDHNSTSFNLPTNSAIVVPTLCFNTNNTPLNVGTNTYVNGVNTAARGGPIANLPLGSPLRLHPRPVAQGAAQCAQRAAAGDVTFTMPGYQLGPYNNLKDFDSLAVDLQPSTSSVRVGSLTVDYDFKSMSMRAITSYIEDTNRTKSYEGTQISNMHIGASYAGITIPSGIGFNSNYQAANGYGNGNFSGTNQRFGVSQEVRFSSPGDAKPFSWVGGVFFSNIRGKQHWENNYYSLEALSASLYGITVNQRYGVPALGNGEGFDWKRQTLKDIEIAAFGEGNYWVTDKLRLTAGIRISRVSFDYFNLFYGPVTSVAVPTEANGGTNSGHVSSSPVTPKLSIQYQLSDRNLVYVSASKGFRAGGVNGRLSQGICGTALAGYGLTAADTPPEYGEDSVWSYEAGGKFRVLNNRVQLNGSVYRIDWSNVQVTTNPGNGCGLSFTVNGKGARSQGFELEAQARLFGGLSVNLALGYTDAKYTDPVVAIVGPTGTYIAAIKDQKFALPPWSANIGLRYEHDVATNMRGYIRGDWRYTSDYSTLPFGANGYSPDSADFPQRQTVNARLGVEYGDFDINLFVNNLFDYDKGNITGGRTGCPLPAQGGTIACSGFTNYNAYRTTSWGVPRQFGFQIAYRH